MAEPLKFEVEMTRIVSTMREGGIIAYEDALRVFTRHFLRYTLQRHGGNITRTAVELGVHRNTLMRLRKECGLPRGGEH